MTAAEIATRLGAARRCGVWWSCCCPVHDDHSPSLSMRDGDRGLIVRCWAGCDPRDVLAALRARGLLGGHDWQPASPRNRDRDDDAARRIALARRIWDVAQDARESPVVGYLASRGIIITMTVPSLLRYAPALRQPDGSRGPAMVARMDSIQGELIGVHRTWLCRDADGRWRRRDRAMLGQASGGAVRLSSAAETLLVGEGIETVLAAMTAIGMPGWAALSTSGLANLELPPILRTVIILADHDVSGAGERAARTAATGWLAEGRRVRIALPPEPGADFNDTLLGHSNARFAEVRDVTA